MRLQIVLALLLPLVASVASTPAMGASEEERPVQRNYVTAPPSPERQTADEPPQRARVA